MLLQLNLMSGVGAASGAATSTKAGRQLSVRKGTAQRHQNITDWLLRGDKDPPGGEDN